MSWSGSDWLCGACNHVNFKKRDSCQKCNFPKYGTQAELYTHSYTNGNHNSRTNSDEVVAGDWYCQNMSCGAHNYASRTTCFRCCSIKSDNGMVGYGTTTDVLMMIGSNSEQQQQLLPGWKAGDWVCIRQGCGLHNYACRMECYKCTTPRDHFGG